MTDRGQLSDDDQRKLDAVCREFREEILRIGTLPDPGNFEARVPESLRAALRQRIAAIVTENQTENTMVPVSQIENPPGRLDLKPRVPGLVPPESSRPTSAVSQSDSDSPDTVIVPQTSKKADEPKVLPSLPASFSIPKHDSESTISEIVPSHDQDHKYVVEKEIDRGGMGVVLQVHDQRLQRTIALKVIRGQEGSGSSTRRTVDAGTLQRFIREAQITGRLDHPGVVPIHELARDENDRLYFTMKYVEGHTLKQVLQEHRDGSQQWTLPRIIDAMIRVCETLAFAHSREVIHRDLKPSNVMVGKFGEVYVMDWGLAKVLGETESEINAAADAEEDSSSYRTMYGAAIGTPFYMPPEQAAGKLDQLDCRTDVYAAGAILYEILTGQRPYWSDPPPTGMSVIRKVLDGPPKDIRELNRKAAPELVAISQKAMNRKMADRYQSASDLAEDLRAFLSQRIVSAHKTGLLTRLKKWVSRNQSLTIAGMLALLTAIGAMCVIAVREYLNRVEIEQTNQALRTSIQQTEKANRQTAGLSLVSHSNNLTTAGDPELASLLAIEAIARYPFSQAREAFYAAAARVLPWTDLKASANMNATDLAWIPGGRGLVVVGFGRGYIRSLEDPRPLSQFINREERPFSSVCCSADGSRLLTSGDDGTFALWDSRSGVRTMEMDIGYPPVLNAGDTHRPNLLGAAYCLNEQCAVMVSANYKIHIIDLNAGRQLSVLDIPVSQENSTDRAPLTSMKVSPNGRMLVVGDAAGHVQLWNLEDRRLVKSMQALFQPVNGISFSSDSLRFVATINETTNSQQSPSAVTRVFSGESGEQLASFELEGLSATCAAWHPSKPVLAFGLSDQTLCLWDVESSSVLGRSAPQPDAVLKLRFAPNGRQLAAQSGATRIVLWQVVQHNGKPRLLYNELLTGHKSRITLMEFDDSGNHLASASRDLVRTWHISTERPVPSFGNIVNPFRLQISPKGDRVFAADSEEQHGYLWTVPDLQEQAVIDFGAPLSIAEFSRDGDHLVTMLTDGTCKVWNAKTGVLESTIRHSGPAYRSSLSGQLLALTGADGTTLWDLTTAQSIRHIPKDTYAMHMVGGSGTILMSASSIAGSRILTRTDLVSGTSTPIENAEVGGLLDFSTSGRLMWATGPTESDSNPLSSDVIVVDVETGRVLLKTHAEDAHVRTASISADDSQLLISYQKHSSCAVEIYSIPSGKRLLRLGDPGEEVPGWSPTFKRVVTRSREQGTRLWDGGSGLAISRMDPSASTSATDLVDFSHDGSVCAVQYQPQPGTDGLGFGPLSLWNAADGTLISALPGENTFRFGSSFVPGGKQFLTVNGSGCMRLWPVDIEGSGPELFKRKLTAEERGMYGIAEQQEETEPHTLREREWADFDEQIRLLIPVTTERRKVAWLLLDQIQTWLGDEPSAAEKSLALKSVDRLITGTFDTDPGVLSKIALLHGTYGTASNAARIMETAARHPRALSLTTPLNQLRREIAPEVASEHAIDELLEAAATAGNDTKRIDDVRKWSQEKSPHFAAYIKARELQLAGQFADAARLFESIKDDEETGPETILHCAECRLQLGDATQAHESLHASLTRESVASPAVWNMWLRIGFHNLKQSPQQLLERMPPDQPRTAGDTPYRTNVIQLLSTLAESKPLRINCGGERYVAANGDVWMADAFYNSGLEYFGTLGDAALFSHPIRNTTDEVLYQSERYFDRNRTDLTPGYHIPLPDGKYSVSLRFAEIYQEVRSFDVMVENIKHVEDYDPSRTEADWATADHRDHEIVIEDGQLDMSFVQRNGTDPKISCFQITPLPAGADGK
ncbi:MAG: protein kinase [Planctomycetaceae bacterium]